MQSQLLKVKYKCKMKKVKCLRLKIIIQDRNQAGAIGATSACLIAPSDASLGTLCTGHCRSNAPHSLRVTYLSVAP